MGRTQGSGLGARVPTRARKEGPGLPEGPRPPQTRRSECPALVLRAACPSPAARGNQESQKPQFQHEKPLLTSSSSRGEA